ncbi:MAG: InlB B-repeat-containing protein [Bacilli bacterium]|nr:InlB B-repeat-containing protein [Bacilli bacterium]
MNYKNKNGFTLVELLAVIVILAVVILIAVTAVIPRMNNAKKKAFIDEALIYMNSIDDVAVTNEETECFNISDMSDYVEQTKDGYSGTLYINNDGRKSINITNGKYYLKANDVPYESDIVETQPTDFIESCSDTSKSYTITYDLNGGTLGTANPSSYTPNTPTITLNNPTKSGYVFTGWSSVNLLDIYEKTPGTLVGSYNTSTRDFDYTKYYAGMSSNNYYFPSYLNSYSLDGKTWTINANGAGYGVAFPIPVKPSTDYYISNQSQSGIGLGYFTSSGELISYAAAPNSGKYGKITTPSNCATLNVVLKPSTLNTEYKYYGVQIEEGTTASDYQEYMAPTTNAKVYRGSTGNRKYIANFTNIFKITLDSQDATTPAIDDVYYQYNTTATIDGTLCYYYLDKELTTCVTNGYYITRPTKTGYTFKGYYTEPNGAGTQYVTASGGFTNNIYRTLGDRTLYAYWVAS